MRSMGYYQDYRSDWIPTELMTNITGMTNVMTNITDLSEMSDLIMVASEALAESVELMVWMGQETDKETDRRTARRPMEGLTGDPQEVSLLDEVSKKSILEKRGEIKCRIHSSLWCSCCGKSQ